MNLKDKTVCVYDDGMQMSVCERLARDFGRVLLFTNWKSDYPKSQDAMIGEGIEGVERIADFWDHIDEVDLFVFMGLYHGDIQRHLTDLGKRVFGGRGADVLERDRWSTHKRIEKLGLPTAEIVKIKGIDNLRQHLKENDDLFVKISEYRGDGETWSHNTYEESEEKLDEIEHKLGKQKHRYEWLVESPIKGKDIVETGFDGICCDGEMLSPTIQGYEVKDCCYACHVKPYEKISPLITDTNTAIAPFLKKHQYRNFISTEIRVGKSKKPICIDWTLRQPSPPGELYMEMCSNFSEVIWNVAAGIPVVPIFEAKYGVEVFIDSSFAENQWQSVRYPDKIKRYVKLRNYAVIDGVRCVIPKYPSFDNVGCVVAFGNSLQECFDRVKEYSDQISGHKLDVSLASMDKLKEIIEKGKVISIDF